MNEQQQNNQVGEYNQVPQQQMQMTQQQNQQQQFQQQPQMVMIQSNNNGVAMKMIPIDTPQVRSWKNISACTGCFAFLVSVAFAIFGVYQIRSAAKTVQTQQNLNGAAKAFPGLLIVLFSIVFGFFTSIFSCITRCIAGSADHTYCDVFVNLLRILVGMLPFYAGVFLLCAIQGGVQILLCLIMLVFDRKIQLAKRTR